MWKRISYFTTKVGNSNGSLYFYSEAGIIPICSIRDCRGFAEWEDAGLKVCQTHREEYDKNVIEN